MINLIVQILKITLVFIIIDLPYLYLNVADFKALIKEIQGKDITLKYIPVLITYLIMSFGLFYFVLNTDKDLKQKIISSALLGFTVYGVFDFTNMAIIEKWKYKQTLIDVIWGTILFTITTILNEKFIVTI